LQEIVKGVELGDQKQKFDSRNLLAERVLAEDQWQHLKIDDIK
jgi:hypothetical protein